MIKKYYILYFLLLISVNGFAQSIAYQTTIQKNGNIMVRNQDIAIRVHIIQDNINGQNVYTEIHHTKTNANGLASLLIGEGKVVSGNYSQISWEAGVFFIKTETDPENGNNYTLEHSQQILSVPYTLYTKKSKNSGPKGKDGISVTNVQILSDSLWVGFSDSTTKNVGKIIKDKGVSVMDANIQKDTLYTEFVNTQIKKTPIERTSTKHYVGEFYGGGIIYYLYDDSMRIQHGLIISLQNLSDSQVWSNVKDTIGFMSFWNGKANTTKIISQSGHQNSAALLCDTFTGGGFTDWYLPSENEIRKLKTSKTELLKIYSGKSNITELFQKYFWASNDLFNYEQDTEEKAIYFYNYSTGKEYKKIKMAVRAIRSF